MSHVSVPATLWKDPFAERTARGLFTAPWIETPSAEGIAAVQHLSETLLQTPARPDDISVILGHLLAVHGHCQRAAGAREPRVALQRYNDALRECEIALSRLHHGKGGTPVALASWALGVHTLIRSQMAMVDDANAARLLAFEALHQLSGIADPLCAGAEADALSAMLLVREPADLESRQIILVNEIRTSTEMIEGEVQRREGDLNHALSGVHANHEKALAWVLGWGALNLLLMATGPLNAVYGSAVPWSLPFLLALPILWYLTWFRPFKEGLNFFDYVRALRRRSLEQFRTAADDLPDPKSRICDVLDPRIEQGQQDHDRLAAFYLFKLPEHCDTCWKAKAILEGVKARLCGDWMAELVDRHPWRLVDVLPTDPTMIPGITRVWFGISEH